MIMLTYKIVQDVIWYIMILLLLLVVILGFYFGIRIAVSNFNAVQMQEVKTALGYFYQDNGRYPTLEEFRSQKVMQTYMETYPAKLYGFFGCDSEYKYTNQRSKSYRLEFCLPTNAHGFEAGINTIESNIR